MVATGDGAGGAFSGDTIDCRIHNIVTSGMISGTPSVEVLTWARGSGGWSLPRRTTALRAPLPPLPTSLSFSLPSASSPFSLHSGGEQGGVLGAAVHGESVVDTASSSRSAAAQTVGNSSEVSYVSASSSTQSLELVYVGSLNLWGGLALFCDALDALLLQEPGFVEGKGVGKSGGGGEVTAAEAEPGSGVGGQVRPRSTLATVTFIGEDGPLAGLGGGVEGNDKKGSELIAERAKRWRRAGLSVTVNPPPPPLTPTTVSVSSDSNVDAGMWGPVAYVIAGGGARLAVLPVWQTITPLHSSIHRLPKFSHLLAYLSSYL